MGVTALQTDMILAQIRSPGYAVSVHRMGWYVEMHAVLLADPTPDNVHLARRLDGDDEQAYRTACALAEMVGIDLADG